MNQSEIIPFQGESKSTISRSAFLLLLVSVVVFVLPACRQKQTAAIDRLIVTTPESPANLITDNPGLYQTVKTFSSDGAPSETWNFRRLKVLSDGSDPGIGLRLSATGEGASLITTTRIQASDVVYLELHGSNLPGQAQFSWAPPGKPFDEARSVQATQGVPGVSLRFDVQGHPEWKNVIGRLRIQFPSENGTVFTPRSFAAFSSKATPEHLSFLASNPFVVELGDTARPSRFLFPGNVLEWEVQARPGDDLRFATGTRILRAAHARLKVTSTSRGEEPMILCDLPLQNEDEDQWEEHTIDLPVSAKTDLTLRFEMVVQEQFEQGPFFTVLGNPTIFRDTTISTHPNLILVSIDTLRADHVSSYGYSRETTPRLDAFFESKGTIFQNVVASAPWTLPSHVTMLSGLDSLTHGANFDDIPDPDEVDLLAETLRQHGFTSVAWTGGGFLAPRYGFASGFDLYKSWPSPHGDSELLDHLQEARGWILDHPNDRFFVFLHTYEVHTPFRPREPHFKHFHGSNSGFSGIVNIKNLPRSRDDGFMTKKQFLFVEGDEDRLATSTDRDLLIDLYDAGIAYTDDALGRFLSDLESEGMLDNTVVVITSDHGESFGEQGHYAHGYLDDSNLMVPLLIAGPGIPKRDQHVGNQVRLVDLTPTLIELLGLPLADHLDGTSLIPILHGKNTEKANIAWSYAPKTNCGISVRVGNRGKLIFNNTAWTPAFRRTEYYDLVNDPAELNDLGGQANPELKLRAEEELSAASHGLNLKATNQSGRQIGVNFGFSAADNLLVLKVKGQEIQPGSLEFGPQRSFTMTLEKNETVELVLESIETKDLTIRGSDIPGVKGSVEHVVNLSQLEDQVTVCIQGGQWHEGTETAPDSDLVIQLEWRGRRRNNNPTTQVSADLQEQLQALGYVE